MENRVGEEERQAEKEKIGIEYRLELINFQDQLFQARKKLKVSENKMSALEEKLKDYLRNKENQISEVMFTAHINAQRIEAQTKTQVGFFLREMEKEIENAQKQLDLLEGRLSAPQPAIPLEEITNTRAEEAPPEVISKPVIEVEDQGIDLVSGLNMVEPAQTDTPAWQEPAAENDLPIAETEAPPPRIRPRIHRNFRRRLGYKAAVKPSGQQDQENSMVNIFTGTNEEITPHEISRVQQETIRCDSFVDVRFYTGAVQDRVIEHHALYVAAEVFVPASNYSVRYTKVSADIVATLMRYDNVILNDVYPFDIIEPNLTNIAKYFFNCVQDVLALMDLGLQSLTIHELPDFRLDITSRSRDIDRQMHTNEDMLQDIRRDLPDQIHVEPEPSGYLKSRLTQILKKR